MTESAPGSSGDYVDPVDRYRQGQPAGKILLDAATDGFIYDEASREPGVTLLDNEAALFEAIEIEKEDTVEKVREKLDAALADIAGRPERASELLKNHHDPDPEGDGIEARARLQAALELIAELDEEASDEEPERPETD